MTPVEYSLNIPKKSIKELGRLELVLSKIFSFMKDQGVPHLGICWINKKPSENYFFVEGTEYENEQGIEAIRHKNIVQKVSKKLLEGKTLITTAFPFNPYPTKLENCPIDHVCVYDRDGPCSHPRLYFHHNEVY